MNMISELRHRITTTGLTILTADEFNQLQREWITQTGAEDMVSAERERLLSVLTRHGSRSSNIFKSFYPSCTGDWVDLRELRQMLKPTDEVSNAAPKE